LNISEDNDAFFLNDPSCGIWVVKSNTVADITSIIGITDIGRNQLQFASLQPEDAGRIVANDAFLCSKILGSIASNWQTVLDFCDHKILAVT